VKLVVGLGNPGRRYANNRHNIGFRCIDYLAREHGIAVDRRRFQCKIGTGQISGVRVVLAKPRTFMNLSGEAVARLTEYYRAAPSDLVVIYDDLDLPLGRLRIRERGSAGGHNGIKSIISHLGTQEFARIRVGAAPLHERPQELKTPDFVLSDFTREEKAEVADLLPNVASAVECLLTEGVVAAMNRFN
jgi:PTH1 family peptidyl-tRNA hydrolase